MSGSNALVRACAAFVLFSAGFSAASGQSWSLVQATGDKTFTFEERLEAFEGGFRATIRSGLGETDEILMDGRRSVLEWRRSYPAEGTVLVGLRRGRWAEIEGTYKGKPYAKKHDFGDLPWFQFQELSYAALLGLPVKGAAEFWTIDRGSLGANKFRAERMADEAVDAAGRRHDAAHFHLTVAGVPAFLFRSSAWARKSDGAFLRLAVPPVLGMPASTVELAAEGP